MKKISLMLATLVSVFALSSGTVHAAGKYITNIKEIRAAPGKCIAASVRMLKGFNPLVLETLNNILGQLSVCMVPKGMPLNAYEIDATGVDFVDLSTHIFAVEDVNHINSEVQDIVNDMLSSQIMVTMGRAKHIKEYFESENPKQFLDDLVNVDKGVQACLEEAKNIRSTLIGPGDFLIKVGLNKYWHDKEFYNTVVIINNKLNMYNESHMTEFESKANYYLDKLSAEHIRIQQVATKYVKEQTLDQSAYGKIFSYYDSVLEELTARITEALGYYKARKDDSTPVGMAYTAKVSFPYGHVSITKNSDGRAVYRLPYTKALAKCQNAYEDAWKDVRNSNPDAKAKYSRLK